MKFGFSVEWAWGSALRAGVLSSCFAKKKVAKEEGDPRVGVPCGDPLRYSKPAGAAELGPAGLRQSSPFIRRFLRCSAPLMGTQKASRNDGSAQEELRSVFCGQQLEKAKNRFHRFSRDAPARAEPHAKRRHRTEKWRRSNPRHPIHRSFNSCKIVVEISSIDLVDESSQRIPSRRIIFSASAIS